jgi:hypothetical protein
MNDYTLPDIFEYVTLASLACKQCDVLLWCTCYMNLVCVWHDGSHGTIDDKDDIWIYVIYVFILWMRISALLFVFESEKIRFWIQNQIKNIFFNSEKS